MESGGKNLGVLRARLTEVEPGLYKAEYVEERRAGQPDSDSVPDSHIGTDAGGVRMWVDEMARGMGYASVAWE